MISLSQDNNTKNMHGLSHSTDRILQHFNVETQANEFSQILIHVLRNDNDSSRIYSVFLLYNFGAFATKLKKFA
jgi:hypothetical protein